MLLFPCLKHPAAAWGQVDGYVLRHGDLLAGEVTAGALGIGAIGKTVLGDSWMNKDLYRFGVSSLANKLLSAVSGTTVTYF